MPDESNTKTSNSPKNIDTPKKPKSKVKVKEKKTKTSNSELYYFSSTGCAFCKQVEPIVDKLIGDGFNILKLDTSESDNAGLKRELENKYNKMVMYDPTIPHSLTKFVDNRLVILFFLEQLTHYI